MVSVCLPSDAFLQHLPSYLGFSYFGRGMSLLGCSSKAQPLLLTVNEGYFLTAVLPELQCEMAPLGPPAPTQPPLLGRGVAPPGFRPWPRMQVVLPGCRPCPGTQSSSPRQFLCCSSLAVQAAAPDLGRGVTPLGRCPWAWGLPGFSP